VILFAFVLAQCCASCIDFFLSSGVNLVQEHDRFETELEKTILSYNCVYIYSNLHNSMFGKIIATMTFSKDCNLPEGMVRHQLESNLCIGVFPVGKNRAPQIWLQKKFKNLTLGPNPKTSEEKFRQFNDTRGRNERILM
jgi:hypothetical protein